MPDPAKPASRMSDFIFNGRADWLLGRMRGDSSVRGLIAEARRAREAELEESKARWVYEASNSGIERLRAENARLAERCADANTECESLRGIVEQYSATCETLKTALRKIAQRHNRQGREAADALAEEKPTTAAEPQKD